MKHTILCVDDEPDILDALERVFRKQYTLLKATSGQEGLKLLKDNTVDVILSDQRMPEMTGVQFLEKSIKINPDAARILLTGYSDIDSVINAINKGQVYRYITKPWDIRDLKIAVERAIERAQMVEEIRDKNQQLEKANAELRTLDQTKSNFMILINHELKTPLTTLVSFLSLLKESKLDDEQKMYMEKILKSSDRLEEIILDALQLVSAETGVTPVNLKKLSDEKIFQQVVDKVGDELNNAKQSVEINACGESLKADEKLTANILHRLLLNAIQHGSNKSPIALSSVKTDDGIEISVQNSGGKISKDMIEHILKPFSLNEEIMHHSKGLGLGLSICQAQLKLMNSELHIESATKGVTCSFKL